MDKCATDILRFHVMPRLLCRKKYKWLPSRFVAPWCCLTLLSKASLPSDMFSSTVAMQELCSGKDIFSFDFNSVTCLLNSMMIVPDWVWSQPLWMATADGSHQTLVESSLSRFCLDGLECVFHLKLCSPGVRVLLLLW